MTWMLAAVSGPEEAEIALAAGADVIDAADPSHPPLGALDPAMVRRVVEAVAGRCMVSAAVGNTAPGAEGPCHLAQAGVDLLRVALGPERKAVGDVDAMAGAARLVAVLFADREHDLAVLERLGEAGFAAAMLDVADKPARRLLDHAGPGRLAEFVARCRAGGLMAGLAGGLEAADVPRLLALKPDILGFRRALCRDHDRLAGIEADAVAAIRRLIPKTADAQPQAAGGNDESDCDRILVRDLVLPVSIGAYRHERETPQRVRFAVTAEVPTEVAARARAADDVGEVFSYDLIVDAIRALVEDRHVNLVETLAEDIAAKVLESPQVRRVTVRVEKLDVGPAVVGVEIVRRASG